MENASMNGADIPKFIEPIMTPKNTCHKIINVQISLQSHVCIKNSNKGRWPHSGISYCVPGHLVPNVLEERTSFILKRHRAQDECQGRARRGYIQVQCDRSVSGCRPIRELWVGSGK
jgi:hypothetical protein